MLQRVIPVGQTLVRDSLSFDAPSNSIWAATTGGAVLTLRLLDQRVSQIGFGYRRPVAAMPGHDGLTVVVVERRGRVWLGRRDQASQNLARLIVDLPGQVLAARRHPDNGRVVVLTTAASQGGSSGPTLVSVDLAAGTATVLAASVTGARTFVVDDARRNAVLLSSLPNGNRALAVVGLDDGVVTPVAGNVPAFDTMVTAPDATVESVIGASADATSPGRLTLARTDGTLGAAVDLARPIRGLARWGSLVFAASGTDVVALEWDLDEGTLPVGAPLGPLYVNGYARLALDVASAGLTLSDVDTVVREGPTAGSISAAVEPPNADGTQPVRLIASVHPGEYHVEVRRRSDGTRLATRRYRVVACWPDENVGPPIAVTGSQQHFMLMNWGGAGASGQYVSPAPELWRVAVVLVSTKDRRWDGLEVAARNDWKDRVIGGGTSLKRFYEEVSYRNTAAGAGSPTGTTVELVGGRVIGPVDLEEGWGDVFKPKDAANLNAGWYTKPTGYEILAGAISSHMADLPDGETIMALADSIVIVVRSGSDAPTEMPGGGSIPTRFIWGHANRTNFWRKTATTFAQGPKPVTIMTNVYPTGVTNPPILTHTLCHEIGHNFGLDDLYDAQNDFPAEINARSPTRADLMATSKTLPHFSVGNRMALGFVKPAWLRRFDFSASPTGGAVTLHAMERLTRVGPPAGRFAGIEVPIQDGWSYLFEFRREQAGQVGDQKLEELTATERFLLGTDLRVSKGESARPPILFLPEDVDEDGPILDAVGQNYRDSDVTNPERMHDFGVTVQQIGAPDADSITVQVTYVAAHRPQLVIRPAPGRGDFKSPDIEMIGPFGLTLPGVIKGMPNVIKVTVHNRGTLQATQVQVHVKWQPFTVSAGDWRQLADPVPFSVPASGSTSFVVPWNLPASVKVGDTEAEHFCVRVDIERYRDPAHPEHEEIVTFDNWAQSNFDSKWVPYGSPSDRIATVATMTNALERAATYFFTVDQSSPWYRVYIGNAWLRLLPSLMRPMDLAYESLADDSVHGAAFDQHLEEIGARPHHIAVTSWLAPENTECDTPREWWGVALDVRAACRAWIEDMRRNGELVTARVKSIRDGVAFDVTHGELHLAAWPEDASDRVVRTQGTIDIDGTARVLLSNETLQQISEGRRVIGAVARPGDASFAQAVSPPQRLN